MIELPRSFENDVQGSTTYLIPIVVINYSWTLSTQKLRMDNIVYEPLVNSLGNIKQSVDIESGKFKISSVKIKLHNIEYNHKRVINDLFKQEIINQPVHIYSKSPSAKELSECLNIYSGYIKDVEESKDYITITIEDRTEQIFSKSIPSHFTENENLPENFRNLPIPIVYGYVDNCPMVYDSKISEAGKFEARSDYHYISSLVTPQIFDNDVYVNIREHAYQLDGQKSNTIYSEMTTQQYELDDINNIVIFDRELKPIASFDTGEVDVDGYVGSPIAFNIVEVEGESVVIFNGGTYKVSFTSPDLGYPQGFAFSELEGMDSGNMLNSSDANPKWEVDEEGVVIYPITFGTDLEPVPDELIPHWYFGQSRSGWASTEDFTHCWGENMLSFGGGGFVSGSNIMSKILRSDGGENSFYYSVNLHMGSGSCWVMTSNVTVNGVSVLPRWHLQGTNTSELFWSVWSDALQQYGSPLPEYEDLYVNTGSKSVSFDGYTDIETNSFVLGDRYWDGTRFRYDSYNGGQAGYFTFKDMKWHRIAVMKDFQKHPIYARVNGRIDNVNLRYTSTVDIMNTQSMRTYFESGLTYETRSTTRSRAGTQTKKSVAKRLPKIIKRRLDKRTKGGGY